MVQVEDLTNISEPEETCKPQKPTLLSKYQIPVQHLEFDYVEKCDNGKELEKILHILRSGEEGYFLELTKTTEARLAEIKPNSKLLRKECPVLSKNEIGRDEWDNLSKELANWMDDVNKKDQELEDRKIKSDVQLVDTEIRKTIDGYKTPEVKTNPKRIASTDYESWDKYDPDTEILKMDLVDEKLKKDALKEQKAKSKKSKTVRLNDFATEAEALFEANREKERGNECFKVGELQNALQHYTNSLQCKPLAAVYTNRALIYNKLQKYKKAIDDCKVALKLEPKNFKAFLRMAQGYEALEQYDEALESIEIAIQIDPNNMIAQQLGNRIRKVCGKNSINNKRFVIQDMESTNTSNVKPLKPILKNVKSNSEIIVKPLDERKDKVIQNAKPPNIKPPSRVIPAAKFSNTKLVTNKNETEKQRTRKAVTGNKGYEVISIPGTSKMPPPYYKIVQSNDLEVIKREKQKILTRPMLLHITTIDTTSDDEYETDPSENTGTVYQGNKTNFSANTKIEDGPDESQLENLKINNDEVIVKEKLNKITLNNTRGQKTNVQIEQNNNKGGGEPCEDNHEFLIPTAEELRSPYTFIQTWNSIRKDDSYIKHAELFKKLDFERIDQVIGYKLDDAMLRRFINCLHRHFMVPGELDRVHAALTNIIRIPRFKMTSMFLEEPDWQRIKQLLQFLDQHGRSLPNNITEIYSNNN